MSPRQRHAIHLADYTPPAYLVDRVELVVKIDPRATSIVSKIAFRPNPESAGEPFFLHGEELKLISARIDGEAVSPEMNDRGLTCNVPAAPFVWEAEVEIAPAANTALEGLYMSNGMYCTQCEAEGFRRITYYPDRPDVMAPFHVRLEGDAPVLLSNGNPVSSGEGWAEWDDPWPKPAYLFALVAGELAAHSDSFLTKSGRQVALNIWVRPEDLGKCGFGMDALKRSMTWEEDVYGREYDLDIFNIVAVDDFNAGAMENKGLNIFNSALVLCSPETATDGDFERIEGVIAHEYFHNWTGNRITCRDWFQLCLKEGLTVFRDQQFTGDTRDHAVKRIRDVLELRSYQFKEDAGPLAHPVRPESFVEINNFYTLTVYEKGAEVIGMLRRIVGTEGYERALDRYFERHDGDAATIEDWLRVFEDATGEDLSQFALWYSQAGTPRLTVREDYEGDTFRLTLSQETPPTPGQPEKSPLHIPVAIGLLGQNGDEVIPTRILTLKDAEQTFEFKGLPTRPIASVLRGFSAPVILDHPRSAGESAFLLAHDTDAFNFWESGRRLAEDVLTRMIRDDEGAPHEFLDAIDRAISDPDRDPAFRALLLDLPSEDDMAKRLSEAGTTPDPDLIHDCHDALARAIAERCDATLSRLHADHQLTGPFSPDARAVGNRALANAALRYLVLIEGPDRAQTQFETADNMTQSLAALGALVRIGEGDATLARFEKRWHSDRLVMNKWFGLQVALAPPTEATEKVKELTDHPHFDWTNPNRFRSVLGAFAMNQAGFHRADGAGYNLLIDWLIRPDRRNPQVAARSVAAFQTMSRWDDGRKILMRQSLERLSLQPDLSADTAEMVNRILS